jgi:hypothetical protein
MTLYVSQAWEDGRMLKIMKIGGGRNIVRIDANGKTIEGASTLDLVLPGESVQIVYRYDAGDWRIEA